MATVGLLVFLLGASAMDSKSLVLPVIICLTGAVVMYAGLRKEVL